MKLKSLLILLIPFALFAQDANTIITKVQNKFDTVNYLTAEFNQIIYSGESSNSFKFSGTFYYKKNDCFRIELPKRKIISDGKSVWNFDEAQNKVIISDAEFDETSFSLKEIIYSYPEKCNLQMVHNTDKVYYIKAIPKNSDLSFKEAYLTINNKFLLSKIEIVDFNNMKFVFELFNIKINQTIDDKLFQFIPSNEVEVIDLR